MRTLIALVGIILGVTVTVLTRKYGPPLILYILSTSDRQRSRP